MEVLLVLALIVMVTALAIPALRGPLDNAQLRTAADAVRAELSSARNLAMRTGEVHLFRYQVGSGDFRVEPWRQTTFDSNDDSTTELLSVESENTMLPEGIAFLDGQTEQDSRSAMVETSIQSMADVDLPADRTIIFYPDGTASTAWLMLRNERDRVLSIRLRGLTGIVRIDQVTSLEQSLSQ